jgi:hypothetical protein
MQRAGRLGVPFAAYRSQYGVSSSRPCNFLSHPPFAHSINSGTAMKTENARNDKPTKSEEKKLDNQLKDTFPASDPPSYSAGSIGAPPKRESEPATGSHPEVEKAEKKVKSGDAAKPETY